MKSYRPRIGKNFTLRDVDPGKTGLDGGQEVVAGQMEQDLKDLYDLHYLMYAENKRGLLIILQGIDASGKDGTVRHLSSGFNPMGTKIYSFKKPSDEELDHDYLWRIHKAMPGRGEVAVFNRSHYEETLVVRVHPEYLKAQRLPSEVANNPDLFRQRFRQINEFERIMTENGTIVLKFFLYISKDEQTKRFNERLNDPQKNWKFSRQDVVESTYWDTYIDAYDRMLRHTHTENARWHVIPADKKWYRNYLVGRTIVRTLKKYQMEFPGIPED